MDERGNWKTLAESPEQSDATEHLGFRRAAITEVKERGINYMLIYDVDYGAADFQNKAPLWGLTLLADHRGAKLYRLD
jgi:hypothetical protein